MTLEGLLRRRQLRKVLPGAEPQRRLEVRRTVERWKSIRWQIRRVATAECRLMACRMGRGPSGWEAVESMETQRMLRSDENPMSSA